MAALVKCSAKPLLSTTKVAKPSVRVSRLASPVLPSRGTRVVARAESGDDFDAVLAKYADKFEKSENKTAIVGYTAAAAGALIFAEWLIHKPILDFLLGFPIQLLGLAVLPVLGVRYFVDNKDVGKDVEDVTQRIAKLLPGLDK